MTASTTPDNPDAAVATDAAPFQFRIRDLLLVMLLIALALAAAMQQSLWLSLAFVVVGISSLAYRRQWSVASAFTIVAIMGTLFVLFGPAAGRGKGHNHGGYCRNNLKQIALALQNYHDVYGSFPPAYIADQNGRPMHSWRVLLLPFIEQERLYSQYRFDEPWDGPNNRKLGAEIRRAYSCPPDHREKSLETSYVAIIGPHTAWPGAKAARLSDFLDGPANVLFVAEVHDSGIHCMEPRDLHVTQMATKINTPHGQGISSEHPHYAHAAFADGMTSRLPETLPADVLRSWINVDDGTLLPPP